MTSNGQRQPGDLYDPIAEPNQSGFMSVSGGHEVYWEECGNPDGEPILFLHGGPGGSCTVEDRRWFDPAQWRIILFDQRGCGKSTPLCELKDNTTLDLVSDIHQLLKVLGVKKVTLYGCSWGSTLALVYGIKHPSTVKAIVVQGIYLGTAWEEVFFRQDGVLRHYPEVWDRFISQVPLEFRNDPFPYYYEKMKNGSAAELEHFAYEWNYLDFSLTGTEPPDDEDIDKEIRSFPYEAMALLEAHYLDNGSFLDEGYILNNLFRLPKVPMIIVQGRHDCMCPLLASYRLAQGWQRLSRTLDYRIVENEGHSGEEISRQVDLAVDALYPRLQEPKKEE